MRIRPSALHASLLLALLLSAAPSHAQELRPGDRVRVLSPTARGAFMVRSVRGDSLELVKPADSAPAVVLVPLSTVERLDVRRPRPRGYGALRGAGIGSLAGLVTGVVIGLADGDDDDQDDFIVLEAEEKAALAGMVLAVTGAGVGAVVGVAAPGSRWVRVDPAAGARVGLAPRRGGGVAVSLSLLVGGGAGR